ncbi:MAG: metallophosphoesterase family protein [Thermoleophilia bacterium]
MKRGATGSMAALAVALLLALAASGCGGGEAPGGTTAREMTVTGETAVAYSFAVMGDSHTVGIDNGILAQAVASAVADGAGFIIHTGDVTNIGAVEEFARYRALMESAGVPVYSIPGNHDIVTAGDSSLFAAAVGEPWGSFDHDGDHFVLVDYSDETYGIGLEQQQWLAADLAANAAAPRLFIFSHIPMVDPEQVPAGYLGEEAKLAAGRLLAVTREQGNVAGYFSGHVHGLLRFRIDGVDAWISGGAGAEPYPSPLIGYYHYLLVRVEADGVEVEVVRL